MSQQFRSLNIKRESVAEVVYKAIRDAIVDKTLLPGSEITEAGIANSLDVSKTPVREALLRLREIHLIEADNKRRLHVVRPSSQTIALAYETRGILEAEAVALVTERANTAQMLEVQEAASQSLQCAEAEDTDGFRYWDAKFHTAIADAAGNAYITTLIKNALLLTTALRARDVPVADNSINCAREHVAIATSIRNEDGAMGKTLMKSHISGVSMNVLTMFQQTQEQQASSQ